MRLFVAVDLPESVKGILDAAVGPLRAALPPARWVNSAAFHLTLAFLGEAASGQLPAVSRVLREKLEQESGFRVHFSGLGTFPNSGPVRILWVGIEPSVRFARLAELAQDGLRSAGVSFDGKPFRSHVTLARCDPPWGPHLRREISAAAASLGDGLSAATFACAGVSLFSSMLGPTGPSYRVEDSFLLQAL